MARKDIIVPELQAGGGNPSAYSSRKAVEFLSPTVIKHLKGAFSATSGGDDGLDRVEAATFLDEIQHISRAQQPPAFLDKEHIDFNEFLGYVASSDFSALGPPESYDLSYPISNYFISSSHNTYLTGNQLYKIDVWDGAPRTLIDDTQQGADDAKKYHFRKHLPSSLASHIPQGLSKREASPAPLPSSAEVSNKPTPWISSSAAMRAEPRVLHGHTLTREVSFREVCGAIRDTAFVTSNLPIIVSLEVHACLEQQEIMVEIIRDEWRGLLVDHNGAHSLDPKLPSPGELHGKILVKVKHITSNTQCDSRLSAISRNSYSSLSSEEEDLIEHENQGEIKKKSKILEALSRLGVYTSGYHFSNFSQPEASIPTHVFALSEKALMSVHETQTAALFSHNRDFLMRAYPKGFRVSSSNLDPVVFWRKGVQMVALNWQKCDEGMMLNEGMFAGEGGWVLKPPGYRSIDGPKQQDPAPAGPSQADAIPHKTLDLRIEVLAGQDIPLPIGDDKPSGFHPYVKCELHVEKPSERSGEPIEGGGRSKEGEFKMRTKSRKGIEPDFESEVLEFKGISKVVEQLSFVRFKIQDNEIGKDALAAWACIRLDRLQHGYRFIHLLDAKGVESHGVLLVKITKALY
ncbi:MAG: hypothetical protein M1827_006903 [Pycnora praestabilis]|nr:MAG: hypothetical protein M1827_006903 [Pycnora praestabilis]